MLDHYYLSLAHNLALQNEGKTSPNPAVGAVVVRGDQIVGAGYHPRAGEPHAEVLAINRAGERARNATLYCSLEPCAHEGKTPACTNHIHQSGIARVVFGAIDQNPRVSGKGASTLKERGLKVDQIHIPEIERFYKPFFQTFRSGRPYVVLKAAVTANGIISPADRNSRWITNEISLNWVHHLRARSDAILVGADTVLLDRPHLTVRAEGLERRPRRVIIDSRFKLNPSDCSLLESDVPILICGSDKAPGNKEEMWKAHGVRTLRFRSLRALLSNLLEEGVVRLVIEGGQKIYTFFHTAGLIDEYVLMIAPRLLTGKNFLNLLGGPEQSLNETERYTIDPPIELDGDLLVRMRKTA